MYGFQRLAKVRVAGSNPVVRSKWPVSHLVDHVSADMRTSPVADKFLPADGHEISPAAATSSPQN